MKISKIVREYIEDTLQERYKDAVKNDPVIKRWESIQKERNSLLRQLKDKYKEQLLKDVACLGFEEGRVVLDIYERYAAGHPAQEAAEARRKELSQQYKTVKTNIFLELELGKATKEDLEVMLAKVSFGE